MTISAQVKAAFGFSQVGSNAFGGPNFSALIDFQQAFTNGTTANKADIAYAAERTVSTASNDDIDLRGVLADALGSTINAAELVALMIWNKQKDGTANSTNLTIGGAGTLGNAFFGFLNDADATIGPISPGGILLLANPDGSGLGTVTAGTGDILRVANGSGATNKYMIGLLARSA